MPTSPGRPRFDPSAVDCFLAQTYENRELVIVTEDWLDYPEDPRIRQVLVREGMSLADKRNRACFEAEGDLICHWDDDDWSAPNRIEFQVAELGSAAVLGFRSMLFYDTRTSEVWRFFDSGPTVNLGTSLLYRAIWWAEHSFKQPNVAWGEDIGFVRNAAAAGALRLIYAPDLIIAREHGANTCKRDHCGTQYSAGRLQDLPAGFREGVKAVAA